eukprot:TRINITY_DN206_c0_g1_i1.p1 TRINITY_DN206_c0_g1~~TRINITY_DN206_c0_g1_i1.p1  ORF type:complete len:130 (+),score=16.25 TRINITY_DN206_c0_g1_i1:194-583(+)
MLKMHVSRTLMLSQLRNISTKSSLDTYGLKALHRRPIPRRFWLSLQPPAPSVPEIALSNGGGPAKLVPPEPPTNCCMSDCPVCVWDIWAEEMQEYEAKAKEMEPELVIPAKKDPAMDAFFALERKLKSK